MLVLFGLFLVPRYFPSCGSQGTVRLKFATRCIRVPYVELMFNLVLLYMCVARGDVLLTWKQCEKGHPWDLVFLMGGGYALSQACEVRLEDLHENLLILLTSRS